MNQSEQSPPEGERTWDEVLTSLCHLQRVFPDAVAVGGTVEVLTDLEAVAGWETARVRRPYLIVGSLDGIDTGIRQLRRSQHLETTNSDRWAVRTQLVRQLADPRPYDLDHVDLAEYKGIRAPLNTALTSLEDWRGARERGERPAVPPLPGLKT